MSEETAQDATSEEPVFLVGPMRAGTTLLRLMLDHHPEVCFFGEFEYPFARLRGNEWPRRDEFLRNVRTHRVFESSGLDVPDGLDAVELTRSFFDQRVRDSGASVVGATVHSRFDMIPDVWPHARFVHLTRDPRDVARSCIGMGWVGHVYYGARYWLNAERRWDALRSRVSADRCHEVRYEQLIQGPTEVLTALCEFLGVEYSERMFDYEKGSAYERPDPSLVEQWRRKQSNREVELVESVCGDLVRDRGFTPVYSAPRPPTLAERLRLGWTNWSRRAAFRAKRYGVPLWVLRSIVVRLPVRSWRDRVQRRINAVDRRHLR